jgi:hypothetical protein
VSFERGDDAARVEVPDLERPDFSP